MALSVSDELGINYPSGTRLGSAATPNWGWVQGAGRYQGIIQQSWIPDPEAYGGGWWNFNDMRGQVNLIGDGTAYGSGKVAHFWAANTFGPDQVSRICHNPLQDRNGLRNGGATARQSMTGDDCYLVTIDYVPLGGLGAAWSHDYPARYGLEAQCYFEVYRINAGAYTRLDAFFRPGWLFADDWWFLELQVWNADPVNLRVVARAPSSYVAGSCEWDTVPCLPSRCSYQLNYAPFSSWNGGLYVSSDGGSYDGYSWVSGWPDSHQPAMGAPVLYSSTDKSNPSKAWTVWEGEDSSPSRILTGQPGFRYADTQAQFSFAKFSAEEMADRLTMRAGPVNGGSVTLSGVVVPGHTPAVVVI